MCRPASPTNPFCMGWDVYRRQTSSILSWPQQGGCRSVYGSSRRSPSFVVSMPDRTSGVRVTASCVSPMCAEGSHLLLPACYHHLSSPTLSAGAQTRVPLITRLMSGPGQDTVLRTRPAGSQPQLFMLWGWAFCGPDGGSYWQIVLTLQELHLGLCPRSQ